MLLDYGGMIPTDPNKPAEQFEQISGQNEVNETIIFKPKLIAFWRRFPYLLFTTIWGLPNRRELIAL